MNPSTTPTEPQSPHTPPPDDRQAAAADPLSKLHKMSTTAGVGTTEYVAINPLSVAAVLFGLASALVTFAAIFLVIPAVAVVLGLVALRQIRNSSGTQAGRGLAWTGIGLAVLFAALLGSRQVMEILATRDDMARVEALVVVFGNDIAARNYDAAYAKMSPDFTGRVTKDEFASLWNRVQDSEFYGNIAAMRSNGIIKFEDADATRGGTIAVIDLKDKDGRVRNEKDRKSITVRKRGGDWLVDDVPEFFPKRIQLDPRGGPPGSMVTPERPPEAQQ